MTKKEKPLSLIEIKFKILQMTLYELHQLTNPKRVPITRIMNPKKMIFEIRHSALSPFKKIIDWIVPPKPRRKASKSIKIIILDNLIKK